jgi:hypothetical protein
MPKQAKGDKITVYIQGEAPYARRKKCLIAENKIILEPARPGRAPITAAFDRSCIIRDRVGLCRRRVKEFLIVKEGAVHCTSFANPKDYVEPPVTIREIYDYFKATVLHTAANFKPESKTGLYILLILIAVLSGINIAVSAGLIHLK